MNRFLRSRSLLAASAFLLAFLAPRSVSAQG
jgi:hypothetical protein